MHLPSLRLTATECVAGTCDPLGHMGANIPGYAYCLRAIFRQALDMGGFFMLMLVKKHIIRAPPVVKYFICVTLISRCEWQHTLRHNTKSMRYSLSLVNITTGVFLFFQTSTGFACITN